MPILSQSRGDREHLSTTKHKRQEPVNANHVAHSRAITGVIDAQTRIPAPMEWVKERLVREREQHADSDDGGYNDPSQPGKRSQRGQDPTRLVLLAPGYGSPGILEMFYFVAMT